MANPTVTFNFESSNITVQCLKTETMRTIIQRFETKIQQSADSYMYLYSGNQVNLDLTFEQQANHLDRESNQMIILVYKTESNGFKCPYCAKKIKLGEDLNDIIRAYNNLKETINGIKSMLENIIKSSINNAINNQLKIVNMTLNTINEDIKKNNEKLAKILNNNNTNEQKAEKTSNNNKSNNQKEGKILNNKSHNNINKQKSRKIITNNNDNESKNKNIIKGIIEINSDDINKNIKLFYTKTNEDIDVYINKEKINVLKENNNWKYNFNKTGKYMFEIIFNDNITNCKGLFNECSNIISLDFTNFNTSNVTDMSFMFSKCHKLKEIKGINKFITNKVTDMNTMFQGCYELEYLDLTNFDTSNVTDMSFMFNKCNKLKEIKGINKFITNKVTNMKVMFQKCYELEYLDLTNFNTSNVTDMSNMFNQCNKLKYLNVSNLVRQKIC